jgi:hypothetical protein
LVPQGKYEAIMMGTWPASEVGLLASAEKRLISRFGLPKGDWMQHWPASIGDTRLIDPILTGFPGLTDPWERVAAADVLFACFDRLGETLAHDDRWPRFLSQLEQNLGLHAPTIRFWACIDAADDEEDFVVTRDLGRLWSLAHPEADEAEAAADGVHALWDEQASMAFRAALARLAATAERGSVEAAEFLGEIYSLDGPNHDAAVAYKWYHIALFHRGYSVDFCDQNGHPPHYGGPDGDFRNEAMVSDLVRELGYDRVHELDNEAAAWLRVRRGR